MILTITDARRAFCVNGVRTWFEENDLDFKDFIRNGIAVDQLPDVNDALVQRIIAAKVESENGR